MMTTMKRSGAGVLLMLSVSLFAVPVRAANTLSGKITAASATSVSLEGAPRSFGIDKNQTKIYDGKRLVSSAIVGRKATVTYAISGALGTIWTATEIRMALEVAPVKTKTLSSPN